MSRVQLALNVSNIDESVEFYSKLFSTEPAKRMPGYANFAVADPPLKLVLIESGEERGNGIRHALNHLGVEVGSSEEVLRARRHLVGKGFDPTVEESTTCCYALQDKVWLDDPDGASWEFYTVLADAPASTELHGDGECCFDDQTRSGKQDLALPSACC